MKTKLLLLLFLPVCLLASGCDTTRARSKQLARVAQMILNDVTACRLRTE